MSESSRSILAEPSLLEDPAPFYRTLRETPLCYDAELGFYICSHYEQMRRILRDTRSFSNVNSQTMDALRPPPAEVTALRASMLVPANTLVTNDPPSHTRYRNMVDAPFTPRAVEGLRAEILRIVNQQIDLFESERCCEFVADFAIPVPIMVIADLLGLPRDLAPQIKAWSDASVEPLGMMISDERFIECTKEVKAFQDYVVAQLELRRQQPQEDLLTHLVQVEDEQNNKLSDAEIVSLTSQFLVAGNETTTNGLAAGMRMLCEDSALVSTLRKDPQRLLTFVNEVLRLAAPVQGLFRVVTRDTTLDGVQLPKGARIMLRFAAANRDPEKYADADLIDINRHNAGTHLAFGAGIHHCIGANLAREEMTQAFLTLVQRLDQFALTASAGTPTHQPSLILRGLKALSINFESYS